MPTDAPAPPVGGRGLAIGTAVVLVLLFAATGSGRVIYAPHAVLALIVTGLPYLFGAMCLWCLGAWLLVPGNRVLLGCLAAVLIASGLLWGAGVPRQADVGAGLPVRVMSWNVRRLWGDPAAEADATRCVVEQIEAADPQLVTLLEVSREDVDALSSSLALDCIHTDYLGSGATERGGLAACVRGEDWELLGGRALRFTAKDDWRYVFTEVAHEGHVVNLIAVHLHPYYPLRTETLAELGRSGELVYQTQGDQTAALLERVRGFEDPTLLAGDFNSTRDGALHAGLRDSLRDAWERGGRGFGGTVRLFGFLPLRIDYVYVTPDFEVVSAEVPAAGCSDHRPVVTDLVLSD